MTMAILIHSKKTTVQKILHWTACFFGGLVTAYCLLRIVITVHASFYDLEKFNFSHSLGYYLKQNGLAKTIFTFLGALVEFLLYLLLCRREKEGRPLPWGKRYASVMLVIHVVILILGNLLCMYRPYPSRAFDSAVKYWRGIGIMTILPSALYCAAYLTCVKKHTSKLKQDTVASSTEK